MANGKLDCCIDQTFYLRFASGAISDEARVVMIGKYLEEELPRSTAIEVAQHLEICGGCKQFFVELERAATSPVREQIPYVVCPASEVLDLFLFDPHTLSIGEKQKIESHLKECPMCNEESEWLRNIERSPDMDTSRFSRRWLAYSASIAAVFVLAFIAFLFWGRVNTDFPDKELRALAVIKQPDDIDFESLAKTSISLSPAGQEVYEQGVRFFKARNYDQAALRFQSVLNTAPHSGALFLLGYCYYGLKEEEKAFELCERAEEMQPKANERCFFLVHIALKTGHFDRAIMEICALYHDSPHDPVIRNLYQKITALTRTRIIKM